MGDDVQHCQSVYGSPHGTTIYPTLHPAPPSHHTPLPPHPSHHTYTHHTHPHPNQRIIVVFIDIFVAAGCWILIL